MTRLAPICVVVALGFVFAVFTGCEREDAVIPDNAATERDVEFDYKVETPEDLPPMIVVDPEDIETDTSSPTSTAPRTEPMTPQQRIEATPGEGEPGAPPSGVDDVPDVDFDLRRESVPVPEPRTVAPESSRLRLRFPTPFRIASDPAQVT